MTAPNITASFSQGVQAAFAGIKVALFDAGVRAAYLRVMAGLLALTLALDVLGVWGIVSLVDPAAFEGWRALAMQGLRVLGIVLVIVAGPILALLTMNVLFPFFNEPMFMAGLRAVDPARAERVAAGPGMPLATSAGIALTRLLRYLGLSLALLLLGLVPLVGSIAAPLGQALLTARTVAWELMDPYFDRLDIRGPEQREFVARHRNALLGFGLPLALLLAIPLLGPLLFGLVQGAAGTFLVRLIPPHERELTAPRSTPVSR
jgi:uncharacterized protein involved in cysteine biosynthesis